MQRVTILLLGITLALLTACNTQKPTVITQKGLDTNDTSQFSFDGKSDSSTVII
ncbi:MAG: hypothetical protein HC892_00955 [Saprospiraceae bacterium]|nr:hypothetical protein [Saprospiraceae bacterium]